MDIIDTLKTCCTLYTPPLNAVDKSHNLTKLELNTEVYILQIFQYPAWEGGGKNICTLGQKMGRIICTWDFSEKYK